MALNVKHGSKHCDSSDDMCCLWNFPWLRKLENSSGFLIMTSMAPFDLDFRDIGFPFTDIRWFDLLVMSPNNEKSSGVFAQKASSLSFWCVLFLDLDFLISSRTASSEGLLSTGWFLSNLESLFNLSSTYLLREEISLK